MIHAIGELQESCHPWVIYIGAENEVIRIELTQEIFSQKTLNEISRRLDRVIKLADRLDLENRGDKIKILAKLLKDRYGRNEGQAET